VLASAATACRAGGRESTLVGRWQPACRPAERRAVPFPFVVHRLRYKPSTGNQYSRSIEHLYHPTAWWFARSYTQRTDGMIARRVPGPGNNAIPRTLHKRGCHSRRCVKAKPLRGAVQTMTRWACGVWYVGDRWGAARVRRRRVDALCYRAVHADTVEVLEGQRDEAMGKQHPRRPCHGHQCC
jgi:hypothetical protein